jgi:NADPH-dependent glutamate synthase beta subunit-like oxidoreductase/2,4-dienoyl-CoA reductase-like NADH-dependent reductase (Old Yellow Enzyme family)
MKSDMEIPAYQPFYISSLADLRGEIARLGVGVPLDEDLTRLAQPLSIGQKKIPNRFCAQPIAGGDAQADGAPGELTRRRYRRYAEGRFGLIWVERTAACSPEKPGQLCLNENTVAAFRAIVDEMRAASNEQPVIIIQLASEQSDTILRAAKLAAEAGFDGVDLQCSRDVLPDALARVRESIPDLLLATRLCAYDAVRGGFGVSASDYRKPDPAKPIQFVQHLCANSLALLNVTAASPILRGVERGVRGRSDFENPDEHPLMTIERQLLLARTLRKAVPELPVIGSGLSWLRQFVPQVAAGALRDGMFDFVGMGRAALAHPSAPTEIFSHGRMEAGSACMFCFACSQLRDEGEPVGCVLRDPAVYGRVYRQMRRFDSDQFLAGATRCHLCEAAPCVSASPTRVDIPAFIQAFRNGDESRAYEIIRERDPLPELTSRFSPAWLESEGACIETTLTGTAVPILDLQYTIAWRARERGETGARVPQNATEKSVAVVGGGPAGIAAAVRLVEFGHTVHLHEQTEQLGGVPERVLSARQSFVSPRAEIDVLLQPALASARLEIHFGSSLGSNLRLEDLHAKHDAVLVATGLWQERSLAKAGGVIGALDFLESTDHPVPDRVAILAGGDSAMDAARAIQSRGAKEIYIVFGGPRSAMHWHMPESWFATSGVQAMMNWQPLGYETDHEGHVRGVRLRHAEFGSEAVLPVALVIEAMGLQAADCVHTALAGENARVYSAGALVNGGASVGQCVAEGIAIAGTIHHDLSE